MNLPEDSHSEPPKTRILVVDDEQHIRDLLTRCLESNGYSCVQAADATEAWKLVKQEPFALVLSDVNMPGVSGIKLVNDILREVPDTGVIMITGVDDPKLAELALEKGAYGYVLKPFRLSEILINVSNALRRRRLEIEKRTYQDDLEQIVVERTAALHRTVDQLQTAEKELLKSREETIQRLATAAEFRDGETAEHIQRMSLYCSMLARRIGLDDKHVELIRIASPMHDIGKVGIPDHILKKPGRHTHEEFEIMKRHAEIGHQILSGSGSKLLDTAAIIAWTQHEQWAGGGYPRGLSGDQIPLEGRITAVADVFDALTSKRVYKPAYPVEQSLEIMSRGRGTQFDPTVLDHFFDSMDEVRDIKKRHANPEGLAEPEQTEWVEDVKADPLIPNAKS